MIKLELEKYCDECPQFEPDVDAKLSTLHTYDISTNEQKTVYKGNTVVRCANRDRCYAIATHIRHQLMKNIPDGQREEPKT